MKTVTIYLVDYENTNKNGLTGISSLKENDTVYIFYSSACPKLPMETLKNNSAQVCTVEVAPGKQALDIQMSSYIGHLLQKTNREYRIVSNDTDFDKIVAFWHNRGYYNVSRAPFIGADKQNQTLQLSAENAEQCNKMPSINDPEVKIWVESLLMKYSQSKDKKSRIHGELIKKFGQNDGRSLYMQIKKKLA